MKNLKLIGFLMILASSLMFIQCTSDPIEGPQGIAGVDGYEGVDGVNGANGADGTASCVACHNESHRTEIKEAYATSLHATGTAYKRGVDAACAQCHGNDGYVDYITTGSVKPNTYDSTGKLIANAYTETAMKCTTCHSMHSTFDFENDGPDYALRNTDAVALIIDPAVSIDFGGTSNNCITCHQPRNSYAVPAGTGNYTINSSRFGPHHGPQSTILEGIMGANYAGTVGYPGVGSAGHRTGASCVACHMGETTGEEDGSHSFNVTEKACLTCHPSGAPAEVAGFAADYLTLHNLLVTKKYISETGSVLGASGANASATNTLVVPVKEAQAIWNYKTLEEDKSKGVHNPAYTKALLKNSIQALQ